MSVEDDLFESKDSEEEGFKRLDEDRRRRGFELLDWGLAGYPLASRFRGTVTNTGGIIDKWERKTDAYCSSFLTQISIGLRENEIAQSPLNRGGLKILWRDLLEDVRR